MHKITAKEQNTEHPLERDSNFFEKQKVVLSCKSERKIRTQTTNEGTNGKNGGGKMDRGGEIASPDCLGSDTSRGEKSRATDV